jgi:ubiquinone/menaquinone biosynthesis C-methylase UbiE
VRKALKPPPGERILEVGPGDGRMAVRVARWIGPEGTLDVFDIQHRMLELTMRRAQRKGVTNLRPAQGEAGAELPYPDGTFDAAYLITVLGEIPDRDAALHQLRRVLRSGGRLVVGEFFLDRDFTPRRELRRRAEAVGFTPVDRGGPPFAYLARFETPRRHYPSATPRPPHNTSLERQRRSPLISADRQYGVTRSGTGAIRSSRLSRIATVAHLARR